MDPQCFLHQLKQTRPKPHGFLQPIFIAQTSAQDRRIQLPLASPLVPTPAYHGQLLW